MKLMPRSSFTIHYILFLVIVLISLNIVTASDQEWHETSVEEESHVIINCCPENGMACSGGADCHNGICRYTCSNSPFEEGCDCRVSEPPPPPDNDTSWIVIVGIMVVLGGGLVIGAKKITGKRGESVDKKEREKEKEQIRYILQLSTDRVTVTPDSPAKLKVTAWKVVGSRPPVPAPEAAITLTVAAGNEGLSVTPTSGTGSVQATITLVSQVSKSPVMVTVTASAKNISVSSQVTVEIPAEYLMEFF